MLARLRDWGLDERRVRPAIAFELARRADAHLLFDAAERAYLDDLDLRSAAWADRPRARDRLVVILKATRLCNLRCSYCHAWREGPGQLMSFEVLAETTAQVLRLHKPREIEFVWHGGEVTTLPPGTLRRALWLQAHLAGPAQVIRNSIQTNAYNISDAWIDLLVDAGIGVGVSIDGAPDAHDRNRRTIGGKPTFARVLDNLARLTSAGLRVGVLLVVTPELRDAGPGPLLESLVARGITQVALLNEIPSMKVTLPQPGANYLPFDDYVAFLRALHRVWWSSYRHAIRIRELDAYVSALQGGGHQTCTIAGNCMGDYLTIDPDGSISACDKFVGSEAHQFSPLIAADSLYDGERLRRARARADDDVAGMTACPYFHACRGGCPHDNTIARLRSTAPAPCCGLRPLFEDLQRRTE